MICSLSSTPCHNLFSSSSSALGEVSNASSIPLRTRSEESVLDKSVWVVYSHITGTDGELPSHSEERCIVCGSKRTNMWGKNGNNIGCSSGRSKYNRQRKA